ncbi:ChbG/HpnK family deacetylase [Mesorhizobium sp. NBSH29]|uniref:ChbG/HpnK family deacetylase n=1 Tax=Mesorhizobium sp. NBSH29 TaxID=2654249 RepID=UPI0018968232|nr:ChbG/HpnK family deacetylase [Mesorhizobium sp. NBSH29]QPC86452.1 ChbG/HpnK family deacetylase [Mesorhizobium sp. NBSH29]
MLIADDFGLGRGHDRVILSLLEAGKLDGTSVMVNTAITAQDISRLRALRRAGVAQVGLHLNLTHELPGIGATWRLGSLLLMGLAGRLQRAAINRALSSQADIFVNLFGEGPDFIDGHQHCHVFPGVAKLVAPLAGNAWLRIPVPSTWAQKWLNVRAGGNKTVLIMIFALWARRLFRAQRCQTNKDFSGFLRLDRPHDVARWLPRVIAQAGQDCVVMVHPGDATDPLQCTGHAPRSRAIEAQIIAEYRL